MDESEDASGRERGYEQRYDHDREDAKPHDNFRIARRVPSFAVVDDEVELVVIHSNSLTQSQPLRIPPESNERKQAQQQE